MPNPFFKFVAAKSDDTAELMLNDVIGFWGNNAKDFHRQLKDVKAKKIAVHINSPGGNVVDGYAIYNMLRAHGAQIEVHIDGMAASIASVIAMAGDKIIMPENTLMFIHQPSTSLFGNAEDFKKVVSDLEKISEGIKGIYMARTKQTDKAITKMMDEETLLTAKECKNLGFCDEIIPELKAAALYSDEAYFSTSVAEKIKNIQFPSAIPAGGQEKQPTSNMKFKTQEEAENRVAALEAENQLLTTSVATAKTEAHQKATLDAKNAAKARCDGIVAIQAKYNKDGDLNAATATALAGDTTPEQFQVIVTDLIGNRPAKAAIVTDAGGGAAAGTKSDPDFGKAYEACKNMAERQELIKNRRKEADAYLAKARQS